MDLPYQCLILDHDDTAVNSTALIHYPSHVESMRRLRPQTAAIDLNGWFLKNFEPGIMSYLQEELGFIPESALPGLAKSLNLSRAEVHGVVSFYHDYRRDPAGRHVIKVCRAEACQSMGADELIRQIERFLGVKLGQTTADGAITVEAVYCLGNCALSPAMMVDGRLVGRADAAKFEKIAAECRS